MSTYLSMVLPFFFSITVLSLFAVMIMLSISQKDTEGPYTVIVRGTLGALPVDYYFLVADTLLNRGRLVDPE